MLACSCGLQNGRSCMYNIPESIENQIFARVNMTSFSSAQSASRLCACVPAFCQCRSCIRVGDGEHAGSQSFSPCLVGSVQKGFTGIGGKVKKRQLYHNWRHPLPGKQKKARCVLVFKTLNNILKHIFLPALMTGNRRRVEQFLVNNLIQRNQNTTMKN